MSAPLAMLQFGSAAMLAWGLAAALPIAIHLWTRRARRQERWAAMAILLGALEKTARRAQLEQWLLLAVRVAILLLFAVALADPQWVRPNAASSEAGAEPRLVVLVVDGSYSMDYRGEGPSRFATAQELARRTVEQGGTRDAYCLVLMGNEPRLVLREPVFEHEQVVREIGELHVGHGGADLTATLTHVETLLRGIGPEGGPRPFAAKRVVIFSDLQRRTWNAAGTAECQAVIRRLESLATLEVVDVGGVGSGENAAIEDLAVDEPLVVTGSDVRLFATLRNFSREDARRQSVEFFVDGVRVGRTLVDFPAGATARAEIVHRFTSAGDHVVEARLGEDGLVLDDRRWLSVPVRNRIRVLVVGGQPGETRLISLALQPASTATGMEVIEGLESRLLESDLTEFDCVILANVRRFGQADARTLHRFVIEGGGLIVFAGDQVDLGNYNSLLVDEPATALLPARLGEVAPVGDYRFDPLGYEHPVVAPFRGFPRAGLLTTPTWKYVRLTPAENARTMLAFSNRDAAAVERRVGRGRCVLVATAASPNSLDRGPEGVRPWTSLPTWPSFPPLLHEMVRLCIGDQAAWQNVLVGDPISGPAALGANEIEIVDPTGRRTTVNTVQRAGDAGWVYHGAERCGVYELRSGDKVSRVAMNLDTAESDLARMDDELLPSALKLHESATMPEAVADRATSPYFRWLLAAVIVLLVAEPWVARGFGRGRK